MDFWEMLAKSLREDANVEELKAKFDEFKNEQLNGVISNKEKILKEKKDIQAELDELKKNFKPFLDNEVTFQMYTELQVENEALKKSSNSPDDIKEREKSILDQGKTLKEKELRPEIERLQAELDSRDSNLKQYSERYQRYRVENEVVGSLKELGVEYDDVWLDGLLNKSKFEYNEIEDKMEIELYVPENKSVVPLDDWKKIFPNSTQGKKMIKAPKNVGGSSRGGGFGFGDKKQLSPEDVYGGMFK